MQAIIELTEYERNVEILADEPLAEWVQRSEEWSHDEYVRAVPDEAANQLRLYRFPAGSEPGERDGMYRTVLDGVSFQTQTVRDAHPKVYNLHATDAMTVLTFLRAVASDDRDGRVVVDYWEDNGKQLTERNELTEETLRLLYKHDGTTALEVGINSIYANDVQMLAYF